MKRREQQTWSLTGGGRGFTVPAGLCLFLLTACLLLLHPAAVPAQAQQKGEQEQRYVTIDFNDVDINLFIKYISELSGKNFIVDRTVKGKVTIISPTRITEEEAYRVFESVLEVHGFTTVPSGSVIKIIPSVKARSQSIETIRAEQRMRPEDKIVTQLIPLKHTSPEEMKRLIAPLVSKTSVVIAHADSGMLIMTEFQSNINRLLEIIREIDVPSVGEELVVLPLQYASAADISKAMSQLFVRTAAAKGQRVDPIKIIPYERTNSLIVFASKNNIQKVRDLLARIDVEAPKGTGKIQVYYLQHASAEELVKVLTNLPESKSGPVDPKAKAAAPPISKDVRIMADVETNSLIITGPRDEYLVLEEVIKKLDIPRRMVYIEALIMEVSVTKQFEIGVQWGTGGIFGDGTGKMYTGFSGTRDAPFAQLQGDNNITTDSFLMPSGFSFGVLKQGIQIGNMFFPNLSAVLKAYKDDSDVEIIATPQILTTDNKKAEIKVGQNVPYITSQNTTAAQQDYTNYEYRDVATSLSILPQINQSDLVRLEIGVDVIKLKDQNDSSGRPTTLKRTANTTVVVHNEETVVIGGIIGQDSSSGEYKVPLLGDIPLIGWLFKTRGEFKEKTNLFIFITPHIVENPAEIASLYYQKRDVMEYVKSGSSEIPDLKFKGGVRNRKHAAALTDMGFANMQKNDYSRARLFFNQALKVDPEYPSAMLNLGVLSEREGNTGNAIREYRRILDLTPREGEEKEVAEENRLLQEVQALAAENLRRLGFGVEKGEAAEAGGRKTPTQ
ncbi:MAG: type II secretion system secretin GspD [Desulfobulbaceae bacterium]